MSSKIHTYHCVCSQFLLATTTPLESCHNRAGEGLDKAIILPFENFPNSADEDQVPKHGYASLLNTVVERKPIAIRRSDGFETRYQQRCGRCDLVIGYHLDRIQYDDQLQTGRRKDVLYILPGALKSTTEMAGGSNSST